ncbi:MAG: hypothetical protein ACI82G_000036 [Bradymonadia bacterium]|jgi:hypothetical protein
MSRFDEGDRAQIAKSPLGAAPSMPQTTTTMIFKGKA